MKLIEHSNLLGYVVAFESDTMVCLYYYCDNTPSDEVISAIKTLFGDVTLILTNNVDTALEMCNTPHISDNDYFSIKNAINEVSAN